MATWQDTLKDALGSLKFNLGYGTPGFNANLGNAGGLDPELMALVKEMMSRPDAQGITNNAKPKSAQQSYSQMAGDVLNNTYGGGMAFPPWGGTVAPYPQAGALRY